MKKYPLHILFILLVASSWMSCTNEISDEDIATKTSLVSRPTVPVYNNEVQIGNQIWMLKNLNVSKYRNGDLIPQVTDAAQWEWLTTGAWCYYANNTTNGVVYGKLYNWYAVNDPRGLAPVGYHIPSDAEWATLTNFLGGEGYAGGKMKTNTLWTSPNTGATNSSRFTGLPAGNRNPNGPYLNIGGYATWWSSSEFDITHVWYRTLSYDNGTAYRYYISKNYGFSVRCVKD